MSDKILLAKCPEWKVPRHLYEKKLMADRKEEKLGDILRSSASRISWLKDPNNQLRKMLDFFQSHGVAMGSDHWPEQVINMWDRNERESHAFYRLLNQWRENKLPDFYRLEQDLEHARKMYIKFQPKVEERCDCCGWGGARLIGNGYAICEDCLPENQLTSGETVID